jgi:hypothetical protein
MHVEGAEGEDQMNGCVGAGMALMMKGCAGDTDGGNEEGPGSGTSTEDCGNCLSLTMAPTGDFSCFEPALDHVSAVWLDQPIDPDKASMVTLEGQVRDFESDDPRNQTTVSLWFDDLAEGSADTSATTDGDGWITLEGPTCTPVSYLALRNPGLDDAKPTYKSHQVYSGDASVEAEYITVSTMTYFTVPALVNLSPDPTKSVIAGTAFDCTREPDTLSDIDDGKIEGAEVVVTDLDGQPLEGVFVKYFIENFPDPEQPHTSQDGLWVAINVPPGDVRVEMWGLVDGQEGLLGSTQLRTYADSINIANIFTGHDGVKYPEDCLLDPDASE